MMHTMQTILSLFIGISMAEMSYKENKKSRCTIDNMYDYIIVGAGTAGSALASQLSRDGDTVLLIEEGGWSNQFTEGVTHAVGWFGLLFDPRINRMYDTTPQTHLNNRITWMPRAKITGGCGSINAMVWILGNQLDYDERWGPINNWSWDNDLKYYWNYIQSTFDTEIVDKNEFFVDKFIKSAEYNGYRYNPDPNDFQNNGQGGVSLRRFMGRLEGNIALRESSWTAYIEPILKERDNLDVIVYTKVNKILFQTAATKLIKPRAYGVETVGIGDYKINQFFARKEVIISAGVIDTPKLLMLSGIGDCNELNNLNIKCIANVVGVGKSLQDHTFSAIWGPPLKDQNMELPPQPFDNYGVIAIDEDGEYYNSLTVGVNFVDFTSKAIGSYAEPFHYESRGEVLLKDNNPDSPPLINPKFLSTEADEKKFIQVVRKSRDLIYTPELMDLFEEPENEISPGWHIQTDEEILEWGKSTTRTDFHPAGTCKMGNNFDDEMVVVDNRLRVKGVNNLRVVDGSIMPQLISGNPNQITVIIGLKAADMILEDNGGNSYSDSGEKNWKAYSMH